MHITSSARCSCAPSANAFVCQLGLVHASVDVSLSIISMLTALRKTLVRPAQSLVIDVALSAPLAGVMGDEGRLTRIMKRAGVGRVELDTLSAGDIASIAGMPTAGIADTVAEVAAREGLDPGTIEPPTMRFAWHLAGSGSE